jgi:hypothetical protein
MKKVKIKIWQGFHQTTDYIVLHVDERAIDTYYGIDTTYLTPYQIKRADKHLCGISGCKCGGVSNNDVQWVEL